MAYKNADWVKETTATTGTGPLTLAGAAGVDAVTFTSVLDIGDTCSYAIISSTGTERETGIGTRTASNILARTTVKSSTNSGFLVSFGEGVKTVHLGPIAGTQIPYNPITNKLGLSIGAHSDTVFTSLVAGQAIKFDGTNWTNQQMDSTLGGFPVILTSAQENDTIQLKSSAWKNIPQEALADGGNF